MKPRRMWVPFALAALLVAAAGTASAQDEAPSVGIPGAPAPSVTPAVGPAVTPPSPGGAAAGEQPVAGGTNEKPAPLFDKDRLPSLIVILALTSLIVFFIRRSRRGAPVFVRKIAGLDAVDDAVGRATEMGKPVLYIPGIGDMSQVATLASLSILRRVADKVAEYQADLRVPCSDPIVHATAQETVKAAYIEAGRPDLFSEDKVFYLTYDQFGYAAGVDGIMLRERPGAVFLQGWFAAESLVMAETGNSINAIQIAGTDQTSQLPFLVAACDYTLIGEELFAAASYLSRDPIQLGTLKSQDVLKVALAACVTAGAVLATAAAIFTGGNAHQVFQFFSGLFPGAGG